MMVMTSLHSHHADPRTQDTDTGLMTQVTGGALNSARVRALPFYCFRMAVQDEDVIIV